MRKLALLAAAAATFCACSSGPEISYRPAPQILPMNIKKIAIRMPINKTQQFGLEDKFALDIRDEFLNDGRYPVVPEADCDGIVVPTITRYILTPIQFDQNLTPTAYKLLILVDLQFVDRATNTALWEEKNMEGVQQFAAATLPGGMTEEEAREAIWTNLSKDIVTRVIDGFGTVTGDTQRRITGDAPSTEPASPSPAPIPPVTNPY